MSYIEIVDMILAVLYGLFGILTFHFLFFAVVGLFGKKTFPETEKKGRYGVIIPARNEEAVVGNLIRSIQASDYPLDKLVIFTIAHNCTDRTAEVAREAGAVVYEYNNPEECTMGYAFRQLFKCIEEDYGTQTFDGFFLFNADNLVDKAFFDRMNDAFVAEGETHVITSFRNSKNFGSNPMSAMYGMYFAYGCRYEARGRTFLDCSTRVHGTGYLIPPSLVKNGWEYVTLTEDWEFTADQILKDTKIIYCDDAVFYDEQPTNLRVMYRQRLRWSRGHLLVCVSRLRDLIRGLLRSPKKGGVKHKFSTFDLSVNILPVCVITVALSLFRIILYLFAPLFGGDFFAEFFRWIKEMLFTFGLSYLFLVLGSTVLYFVERDRLPHIRARVLIPCILIWPFFLLESIPSEIIALFKRNLGWKPIPHTDTTSSETLKTRKTFKEARQK